MMGHNIPFKEVVWKIIPKYPFYPFIFVALVSTTITGDIGTP